MKVLNILTDSPMRGGPGCCCTYRAFSLRAEQPGCSCWVPPPAPGFKRPHPFSQVHPVPPPPTSSARFSRQKPGLQTESHRFKCYLYADTSQIYASRLDLSPGLQTCTSSCLFGISTGVFNSCLRLNTAKTQLCPPPTKGIAVQFAILLFSSRKFLLSCSQAPNHEPSLTPVTPHRQSIRNPWPQRLKQIESSANILSTATPL